ncbi:MAG: hypothetical protein E7466_06125 [Ruminococcaceae bacterium]|nr:hypothetical protein [Oscillospiraceae bacterium]
MSTIEKIYEAQLAAQKEQLKQDYTVADSDLTHQRQLNQKATDANLTRTAVESQKAAVNNAELHNAYGLSSGARLQARVAQENQLQADMTALRAAQQQSDAEIERQRGILSQEYASAIRQAQAENDLAKAEALYQQAQKQQAALLERQQAAAQLMAQAGDYSRMASLYGLSSSEVAALQAAQAAAAKQAAEDSNPTMSFSEAKYINDEFGDSTGLGNYFAGRVSNDTYLQMMGGQLRTPAVVSLISSVDGNLERMHIPKNSAQAKNYIYNILNNDTRTGNLTDHEFASLIQYYQLA